MLESGFYNMDCMQALKEFPDKFFDLAIVDPPYGMNATGRHVVKDGAKMAGMTCKLVRMRGASKSLIPPKIYHAFDDTKTPDKDYFEELQRVSKHRVIWGGNFLNDYLGKASCILVWDKGRRGMSQADCELAWTDLKGQSRIIEYKWHGMLQGDMKNKEERIHPTQKPVKLYDWILAHYAAKGSKILDTHVGSASSLIACQRAGLQYWGFEIDPVFYAAAKERLDRECAQMNIFADQ